MKSRRLIVAVASLCLATTMTNGLSGTIFAADDTTTHLTSSDFISTTVFRGTITQELNGRRWREGDRFEYSIIPSLGSTAAFDGSMEQPDNIVITYDDYKKADKAAYQEYLAAKENGEDVGEYVHINSITVPFEIVFHNSGSYNVMIDTVGTPDSIDMSPYYFQRTIEITDDDLGNTIENGLEIVFISEYNGTELPDDDIDDGYLTSDEDEIIEDGTIDDVPTQDENTNDDHNSDTDNSDDNTDEPEDDTLVPPAHEQDDETTDDESSSDEPDDMPTNSENNVTDDDPNPSDDDSVPDIPDDKKDDDKNDGKSDDLKEPEIVVETAPDDTDKTVHGSNNTKTTGTAGSSDGKKGPIENPKTGVMSTKSAASLFTTSILAALTTLMKKKDD